MQTSQFIEELASGNASGAKDILNDMLSTKAFEALEGRKIEIAQNIFNGSVSEEYDQEEYDQLDELSVKTLSSYGKKAEKSNNQKRDIAADHAEKAVNLYDKGTARAVDKSYDHEAKSWDLQKQVKKRTASMNQAAGKIGKKFSKGVM